MLRLIDMTMNKKVAMPGYRDTSRRDETYFEHRKCVERKRPVSHVELRPVAIKKQIFELRGSQIVSIISDSFN